MIELTHTIKSKNGLHARPAGKLVTLAKAYSSDIKIKKGEKMADGKRLLSVMSLGAVYGTELTFIINGSDESEASSKLAELLRVLDTE
jgi:phosphotransferase system HPr (HPr) family protein